jgi:hypothetical protein
MAGLSNLIDLLRFLKRGDIESVPVGFFMGSIIKRKLFIWLPPHTEAVPIDL